MTDLSEIYPDTGKYLKAVDLHNRITTVTIEQVTPQEVGKDSNRERKPVAKFKGRTKQLILNKTNSRILRDLYGSRLEDWEQKKITLVPITVDYPNPGTASIRLEAPKDYVRPTPSEETEEAMSHDDMDDEIPF